MESRIGKKSYPRSPNRPYVRRRYAKPGDQWRVHTVPIIDQTVTAKRLATAETRRDQFFALASGALAAGAFATAERLYLIGQRYQDRESRLKGQAWRASRPRTGKAYRSRSGVKVGPLRPFRDHEDGNCEDAQGRDAWFFGEGHGAFDRYGRFLSGLSGDHALDLISEWQPIEKDQQTPFSACTSDIRYVY